MVRLEDRQLLATFTVSNTLDAVNNNIPVTGSLRWAVDQAAAAGGAGVVDFSSSVFNTPQTITLTQLLTPIQINTPATSITINGPGTGLLTINGGGDGTVFEVDAGASATIEGMTITGASQGDNAAVDDLGSLTMSNCIFTNNATSGLYVADSATVSNCFFLGGNSYFGAGIYVKGGTANFTNCTISNNTGNFDAVGAGVCNQNGTTTLTDCTLSGDSALGSGGVLYNSGTLTVTDCTLSGNSGRRRRQPLQQIRNGDPRRQYDHRRLGLHRRRQPR